VFWSLQQLVSVRYPYTEHCTGCSDLQTCSSVHSSGPCEVATLLPCYSCRTILVLR
jgi:hypothetical protein